MSDNSYWAGQSNEQQNGQYFNSSGNYNNNTGPSNKAYSYAGQYYKNDANTYGYTGYAYNNVPVNHFQSNQIPFDSEEGQKTAVDETGMHNGYINIDL